MPKKSIILITFLGCILCSFTTSNTPSGETLYLKHCKKCHGIDGTKGAFKAKDLTQSNMPDSTIFRLVRNGKKKMPSYKKKMDIHETFLVIEYVKTLRK